MSLEAEVVPELYQIYISVTQNLVFHLVSLTSSSSWPILSVFYRSVLITTVSDLDKSEAEFCFKA